MPKMEDKYGLLGFLKANHDIATSYIQRWYVKETSILRDVRSKLRILFINALNAANAAGNLDGKCEALHKFDKRVKAYRGDKISFSEFTNIMLEERCNEIDEQSIRRLYDELKTYKHMGHKKSAMFLRDVLYVGEADIFTDVTRKKVWPHLIIPVDVVIRYIVERYFCFDKTFEYREEKLSKLLKSEYGEDSMYFEDLWFWGHFSLVRKNKKQVLGEVANEPMLSLDPVMDDDLRSKTKEKISLFLKIAKKRLH